MALTADEVLEKVGSFGWFQKRLLILFNLLTALLFGWSVMVTGIITAEPDWKCAKNSSVCTYDGAINVGNPNYDARCNMSRGEWDFVDGMTSVITEVRLTVLTHYNLVFLPWSSIPSGPEKGLLGEYQVLLTVKFVTAWPD